MRLRRCQKVSKPRSNRPAAAILLGHNLPFLLWTLWAGLRAAGAALPTWACPIDRALINGIPVDRFAIDRLITGCPGCGLTGQYVTLLTTGRLESPWLGAILLGFALVVLISLRRAGLVPIGQSMPHPEQRRF